MNLTLLIDIKKQNATTNDFSSCVFIYLSGVAVS